MHALSYPQSLSLILVRPPCPYLSPTADSSNGSIQAVLGEDYNRADFPVAYDAAKFFVIKSYSEDDVHKSIKYSVWSSTPNGNKRLDAAFREATEKAKAAPSGKCPVYLFFSVSGNCAREMK